MSETETNNSERLISCSFCEQKLSPSSVGEHLMLCGNKTDKCPHCGKFIRRAIFAYHYENNCADLDVIDNDVSSVTQPNASTAASRGNTSSHSSSEAAAGSSKHISITKVDLSTYPTTQNDISHRSTSDFSVVKQITMRCPFCTQECELGEREIHQENCLRNPNNITKRQQLSISHTSGPNINQLNRLDQSDDNDNIPCEYCREPIKANHYEEHTKACGAPEFERRLNQYRPAYVEVNNLWTRCRYCNEERTRLALSIHESMCLAAHDEQYKNIYRLPSLRH